MQTNGINTSETVEPREGCHLTRLVEGSEMNQIHLRYEPGASHPMHSHPDHEQIGYVLSGELTVLRENGEKVVLGPGESYQVDKGERHEPRNDGDEPMESIETFSPPRDLDYWD